MSKQSRVRAKLRGALEAPTIHRIFRSPKSSDPTEGFVVRMGKKWVLVAQKMDGGYPDGLIAVRISDVVSVRGQGQSFETKFALTQPRRDPKELATIKLDHTADVIETMAALSKLVAVEQERKVTSAKWIGTFAGREGKWFWLWEVRPDATWHPRPLAYRLKNVTTVSIDDHYLTALSLVAGKQPSKPKPPPRRRS
ncbi:MAG: hypothetical protein H7226_03355 [Salinibacterium sp.]|nr:hypothetical protein [Salinibacterium sp.]